MPEETTVKITQFFLTSGSTLLTSLKMASDGGCQLNDTEKATVARHLRDAKAPENIPINDANLLRDLVGQVISNYPSGGKNIAYIVSAEPISTYLVDAFA